MPRLTITEQDLMEVLPEDLVKSITPRKLLSESDDGQAIDSANENVIDAVLAALPGAIAGKISKFLPKNYHLTEFEMTISIDGKPFGVGVGGEVLLKFGKK